MSILIFPSSRNRFFVVVIVRDCCYPRWRPICLPKQKTKYILAHRKATITNEVSNFIFSRSRNRFRIATIVCECYFPRWRPILGQNTRICISQLIFLFWRSYLPPSWKVALVHYCQYEKPIPGPSIYEIRHFICYSSLPMSWDIHIFVFGRPYWPPSWKVKLSHYCRYDKSIPWPWKH